MSSRTARRRRAAAIAALFTAFTAFTPAAVAGDSAFGCPAPNKQPVTCVPAGATVYDVAPFPAQTWQGGYHGDCGHGCHWEHVSLLDCPAGQTQAVAITSLIDFESFVKSGYWNDPLRPERGLDETPWFTFTAVCLSG